MEDRDAQFAVSIDVGVVEGLKETKFYGERGQPSWE
jgi:hypothetical protein